jgi:hypothetical protein
MDEKQTAAFMDQINKMSIDELESKLEKALRKLRINPPTTYDTETVRQLLGLKTLQDVRNLTRPGKPLHDALVRRGSFDQRKVKKFLPIFIRRELAAQLGRTSPRFLDDSHSVKCSQCNGIAVEWEGSLLCENGHNGKDPGKTAGAGEANEREQETTT